MRTLLRTTLSGGAAALLVAAGASAAHAAEPLELLRWDTSTCATEGAASPVLRVTDESQLPLSVVHAYGIDDQDGYATVRTGPGPTTLEVTFAPVRAGEHTLYEQNRTPGGPHVLDLAITAPACAAGSPEPSEQVWPKEAAAPGDVSATFGENECREDGDTGDRSPVLPFDYANEGDGEGQIWVEVDGQDTIGTTLSPGSSGTQQVDLLDGEHTYELVGRNVVDDDQSTEGGTVLDSVTRTAPDCSVDEPGTDEPGTDGPGTDGPGTDGPGTDEGGATGTDDGATPVIPAVVQTDSYQRSGSPFAPVALGALAMVLAGGAVRVVRGSRS